MFAESSKIVLSLPRARKTGIFLRCHEGKRLRRKTVLNVSEAVFPAQAFNRTDC
jgi:hypothetical protein